MMIIPATGPLKLDTSKLNSEIIEWTSLKSEDVISGRVISSNSNSAMIQMLGARLEVRTPTPLTPGSLVQFQVESNADGQLLLRTLPKPGPQANGSALSQALTSDQVSIEQSPTAAASNARLASIRDVIDSRLLNMQARQSVSRPTDDAASIGKDKGRDKPVEAVDSQVGGRNANNQGKHGEQPHSSKSSGASASASSVNNTTVFRRAVTLENIVSVDGSNAFPDSEAALATKLKPQNLTAAPDTGRTSSASLPKTEVPSQSGMSNLAETELGTALSKAGLPPTAENLAALRQALSDGRALALSRLRLREAYQPGGLIDTGIEDALAHQEDMLSAALERAGLQASPENVSALREALLPDLHWANSDDVDATAEADGQVSADGETAESDRLPQLQNQQGNVRTLPAFSANTLRAQSPLFNSPEQAAFFTRISSEFNLSAGDTPLAAALVRAGVVVTPGNVSALRQALSEGQASSPETLALLKSAGIDPTPLQTDYLDAILDRNAPKLGALMELMEEGEATPRALHNMALDAQAPTQETANTLQHVLSRLVAADSVKTPPPQDIATNLRGQVLLPAVQSCADVPSPYVYFQMPCQTGRQWRTVEMKLERGPASGRNKPRSTDIVLRLDTEHLGTVEVRLQAFGRDVALSMRVTDPESREKLAAFQNELTDALDHSNVFCKSVKCNVVKAMEPLTQPTPQPVDING